MRIRDPIHGTILLSEEEKAVLDTRYFQRLRTIRQLGFGELAFPGATHTRHAHSLGAMHMASRLFDAVAARASLPETVRQRFRMAVRLAVLCHDLGHMPFSHASESIAPERRKLKLPAWASAGEGQATHEDYTAKIILESELTPLIQKHYSDWNLTPESIVALILGKEAPPESRVSFVFEGVDWFPLMRAMVSGELDADRMDYLMRDSFYTGVNYGRFDLDWIVQNLQPAVKNGQAFLALSRAAAFAFEDFLLSRYHMFVSVYYHHTAVNYDYMLQRYYQEASAEFEIPADVEAFLECDDVALHHALRKSKSPWAERIVRRQGYKLVAHFTERDTGYDLASLHSLLQKENIEHYSIESVFSLSKYYESEGGPPLFIVDLSSGQLVEVAHYIPLYKRYAGAVRMTRIFARPDQRAAAKALVTFPTQGRQP